MKAATLLMVASAYIIGKCDCILRVDVSRETAPFAALWTSVSGARALVGLEYESVIVHFINFCLHFLHFLHF